MGRVLRPGRRFIFRLSPNPRVQRWAAVVGAHSALGVRRLPRNTGHSVSDHSGRIQDRGDGNGLPRPISEVVVVLVVAHRGSGVTAGAVSHTCPGRWRQQLPTTSINESGRHAKSLILGGNNRDQRPQGHSEGGHSEIRLI